MKKLLPVFLFLVALSLSLEASTRADVKVIEATENIRYLSQKIVKDYLFYVLHPKQELQSSLNTTLSSLNEDLRIIAATTKDSDTKDILEFLSYSKDQIKEIINSNINEENTALMMDYSETILEGTNSIADAHKYKFSPGEKMLMIAKKINYLLERIMKYYISLHVGYNTPTNKEQLQLAVKHLEENLAKIDKYKYPKELGVVRKSIDKSWDVNKDFISNLNSLFIPKLLSMSVDYMENLVTQVEIYHSKNQ
jgi:ABC-type antimicrobial peptide transport system permease subunit